MPSFTAKDVQALRQQTGAGMMDAKKALEEHDGDFEAATQQLREKGLAKSAARSDRDNSEGVVGTSLTDTVVAAVELKCETDFVAKSDQFIALADEMAALVASDGEGAISQKDGAIEDLKITLKENIEVGRVVRFEAAAGESLNSYVHIQNGRAVNVVLVHLSGDNAETARDVAMHAAFSRPSYVSREEAPAEAVAAERDALEAITRSEGKPEQAIEKIVEGRLNAWYMEHTLLEQKWVRDEKQTIAQLLGDNEIRNFSQIEIGS